MTFEDPTQRVEFVNFPKALDKAGKFFDDYQIDMDDFDNYADLDEDKKEVERLKEIFEREKRMRTEERLLHEKAMVFEAILIDSAEGAEWMGDNAYATPASDYDDYKNGIDGILEFDVEGGSSQVAGMGIDVTYGHNIKSKVGSIEREIGSGEMGHIKYFNSELSDFHGEMKNVPRFVVGCDIKTVDELINLWVDGSPSDLANHPVQLQILHQLLVQCKYFSDYAKESGQDRVSERYDRVFKIIEPIYRDKTGDEDEDGEIKKPSIVDDFHRDFLREFN